MLPQWTKTLTKCISKVLCGGVQFSNDKGSQINEHLLGQNIHHDNSSQGMPEYDALLTHEIPNVNHVDAHNISDSASVLAEKRTIHDW